MPNMRLSPVCRKQGDGHLFTGINNGGKGPDQQRVKVLGAVLCFTDIFDVKKGSIVKTEPLLLAVSLLFTHYPRPRNRSHQDGFILPIGEHRGLRDL